jgi:uroporphyrinogen-III synthase
MMNTLAKVHVLVTRPEHQSENLISLIEQQGGVAIKFPTLQILGIDETGLTNQLSNLADIDWLIFTSANAVNFALQANGGKIGEFKTKQIAAIGKATASELLSAGLEVSLVPENGYDSESLLAMPQLLKVVHQKIMIVRGQGGREELAKVLKSRGAVVSFWEVYRRVLPESDPSGVISFLEQNLLDIIIITSCESLQNLCIMLGKNNGESLAMIPLVVISGRISRLAAKMGFTRIYVTESPSDRAILDTIILAIEHERGNTKCCN